MKSNAITVPILSTVWVSLCASLVMQRVELSAVFFSFMISFALASIIHRFSRHGLLYSRPQQPQQASLSNGKKRTKQLLPSHTSLHIMTKSLVGIIICIISSLFLLVNKDGVHKGGYSPYRVEWVTTEFQSMAMITGYLAFDLWYTHIYCRPLPSLTNILEDAVTLTIFLILLVKKFDKAGDYHASWMVFTWNACKTIRLGLQVSKHMITEERNQNQESTNVICQFSKQKSFATKLLEDEDCVEVSADIDKMSDTSSDDEYCTSCASSDSKDIMSPWTTFPTKYNSQELNDSHAVAGVESSEISKKDSVDLDRLWTIHGYSYDLTDFIQRHPGGVEAIELGRGRDCTALFESYHPFTMNHRNVLKKYKALKLSAATSLSENKLDREESQPLTKNEKLSRSRKHEDEREKLPLDPFYETLKERADIILRENGIDPIIQRCATSSRFAYYLLIFSCLVITAVIHTKGNSFIGSFLFALFGWLIGALGHDGGHYAVSRTPWINDLSVWGISLLCNPIMWQHQHTYAHHSHTNDFDHDPDLHHFEVLLRVHRKFQANKRYYSKQTNMLYVFWAYTFVVFGTCLKIPYGFLKDGTIYGMVEWTDRVRPLRAFSAVAHIVLYVFIIILGPFFSVLSCLEDRSLLAIISAMAQAGTCVMIHIGTTGLLFAIFSQINHLNELSLTHSCNDGNVHSSSWAAKQVQTSNNFATNSMFWHVFSNGLNMQIEHHLFPGLNHAHLHILAPMVKRTCEEYGVTYKNYESWEDIMKATLTWLETLGSEEN